MGCDEHCVRFHKQPGGSGAAFELATDVSLVELLDRFVFKETMENLNVMRYACGGLF